ncbi:MAG: hypothetical protein NZL99_07590 [Burkholderiaceae bacterium]|nr:hypothetical protein [Burkholderiaceae bacterium]
MKRKDSSRRLRSALIATMLLAACSGEESSRNAAETQPGNSSNVCTGAPPLYTDRVWPSLDSACVVCHSAGRVAGGTRLVFTTGPNFLLENYNHLRQFVANTGDLLLQKSIGQPTHAGGAPFGNANSQQYRDLAELMPALRQPCTNGGGSGTQGSNFWAGVTFSNDATTLARAAILFGGRNPTAQEYAAVASGGTAALRTTIRSYMQGPAFERFLYDVGDTHFLTPGVTVFGNNVGYNAADFPSAANLINNQNVPAAERNRFIASARRENIELMRYIVRNERPWTEMVTANYTVVNGLMARWLNAQVTGTFTNPDDDNEWLPAQIPNQRLGGMREHAGVLSTHPWLMRFPTTPTNRNRHRVYILFQQFLATDVNALAVRPIDDSGNFRVPVLENPNCTSCHDVIDPIAAGFQNWNENNRYLPFRTAAGKDHALPQSYRSNAYPRNANGQPYYQDGDNWFRDQRAPGYGSTPMPGGFTGNNTALQWLGQQVAADPRFALGAVHFWYEGVFGRKPLKQPIDQSSPQYAAKLAAYNAQLQEFQEIAARFRASGYNVKDLLVDLVTSRWFRAERATGLNETRAAELADVGSMNLLLPTQLNLKLTALTGQPWAEFNNPYAGLALNYGDFDGVTRTTRAKSFTMMQTTTIDRLVATRSCAITQADFNRPPAQRLLFPNVTLNDTPATAAGREAIVNNVRHLHRWLWKEDAPATDPEVQRTVKLFEDVWNDRATAPARAVACAYNNGNDPNYTGRAWAAVIAYMLGDPKFLYE